VNGNVRDVAIPEFMEFDDQSLTWKFNVTDKDLNGTEYEIRTRAIVFDGPWKIDGKNTTDESQFWILKLFVFKQPDLDLPPALYKTLSTLEVILD